MSRGEKIQKALETRIETSNLGWEVKRYSDTNDFKSLWELGNDRRLDPDKNILVIWDGFPSNEGGNPNIPIAEFITPIDWAHAYSRHSNRRIQAMILDLYSHTREARIDPDRIGMNRDGIIGNGIQFYSFNKIDFEYARNPLEILEIKKVDANAQADLDYDWWEKFIKAARRYSGRHSMDNILVTIGLEELYLLSSQELKVKYWQRALCKALEWHGIFRFTDNECVTEHHAPLLNSPKPKIVLIDDQAELWKNLLLEWAQPFNNIKIKCEKNADLIIEKLENLANDENDPQTNYFNLNFTGDLNEILIFDLHLFSSGTSDEKQEIEYFERVLNLCERFDELNNLSLDIENSIQEAKQEMTAMNCTTLLPRLIAEINPYIPIIIFSATTQQRNLYSRLRPYERIEELRLEKPVVMGEKFEWSQFTSIKSNFRNKINQAIKLNRLRHIISNAC